MRVQRAPADLIDVGTPSMSPERRKFSSNLAFDLDMLLSDDTYARVMRESDT